MAHTKTSFLLGHYHEQAHVIYCQPGETTLLVTDLTPCHPQSHLWPDQPGDSGHISWEGGLAHFSACCMGAINQEDELFIDQAIPVKRGAEGWRFVVVHPLIGVYQLPTGCTVTIHADSTVRHPLSMGHSANHLCALALNRALISYWRKEINEQDALGQPDFDRLAIETSRVVPYGSVERYRIGKSLRKKGLNSESLLGALTLIEDAINQQLVTWLSADSQVHVSRAGDTIIDSRYWHCTLANEPYATIPCGGTHITELSQIKEINVTITPHEGGFSITNKTTPH